ncbi:MAG: peptidylprolyl isomerase [Desulfurobacteriaceae bacterium]
MVWRKVVVLLFLLFIPFLPLKAKVVDYIVAVVNDEPVLYSELKSYAKENGITDLKVALNSLIEKKMLLTEAKSEGIRVSDKEIEDALKDLKKSNGFISDKEFIKALEKERLTLEEVKEKIKEQILISKLIGKNVRSKVRVSGLEVEKVCRAKKGNVLREVYYIFVTSSEKLKEIEKLLASQKPFEKVAKEFSEDPVTAKRGGYVGKVKKGMLIEPVDSTVWSIKPGKYKVVKGDNGYYLVYVKKEEKEGCNKDEIRKELYMKRFRKALKEYLDSIKKKASVKIYFHGE